MDQLWYTWSTAGLGSVTGHRVRAASQRLLNLHDELYQEIEKHLHYVLPDDINPYDITTASSPYSLAYIATERYGPLLLHRVYAGEDAYGRAGVFFIHVLTNFNTIDITPLDAIDSWHSLFWQTSDTLPAEQVELPVVDKIDLTPGSLSVAEIMRAEINQHHYQENLETLVKAYLTLEGWQNIYLETYAEDSIHSATERNAELIWGLLHCLPPFLAERVTFSTYEGKLDETPDTRIVATCFSSLENLQREPSHPGFILKWGNGTDGSMILREAGIPREYASQNPLSTEQLQACAAYAHYAVEKFLFPATKDKKTLQNFYDMLHAWGINNLSSFLAAYQLFATNRFDAHNIKNILLPENAVVMLAQDYVRDALLSYMVKQSHTSWWDDTGKSLWSNLATNAATQKHLPQILTTFAYSLKESISSELMSGNPYKASIYLPLLEIIAPATKQPELWKQLLEELTHRLQDHEQQYPYELLDDEHLDISIYQNILVDCAPVSGITDEVLAYWLHIAWNDVDAFCTWNIPLDWKARAIARLIRYDTQALPADVNLTSVHIYYEQALYNLACNNAVPSAINHLIFLIKRGYTENVSAVGWLLRSHRLNAHEIEYLLTQTNLKPTELDTLFLNHWEYLLLIVPDKAVVRDCVKRFLNYNLNISILKPKGTGDVLDAIDKRYSASVHSTVECWQLVRETLFVGWDDEARKLITNERKLKALADAIAWLKLQKDPVYWKVLLQYIVPAIHDNHDLFQALRHLAPVSLFAVKSESYYVDFIENIAPYVNEWYKQKKNPGRLMPYIQLAIANALQQEKEDRNFKSNEVLPRIFQQLLQDLDKKTFDYIDDKKWWDNNNGWKIWKQYSEDVRPNGLARMKLPFLKKRETAQIPAIPKSTISSSPQLPIPVPFQNLAASLPPSIFAFPLAAQDATNAVSAQTTRSVSPDSQIKQSAASLKTSVQNVPPSRQPQSSSSDDQYVAWYGFKDQEIKGILFKDFKKIEDLKFCYIEYVTNRNDRKPTLDPVSIKLRENEYFRLINHKTVNDGINATLEMIVQKILLLDKIEEFKDIYGIQLQESVKGVYKEAIKSKYYQRYIQTSMYTPDDLKEVISLFLEYYFFDSYCISEGGLNAWLKHQQEFVIDKNIEKLNNYRKQRKLDVKEC